jgi:hypothetical protein
VRSHARALPVVVVAMFAFLALAAAPAFAAYTQVGQIGGTGPDGENGSGSEDGQFSNLNQVDVNDSSGVLYVADTGNDRVQTFTPTESSADYSAQVAITAPTGIAVDQATGDVYVATATGIEKLTAALSPAAGWTDPGITGTLAVDPSTGDLLVADQGASLIRRFESDGTVAGTFGAERPLDVAVDSSGDVLVVTSTGDLINECEATSSVVRYSGAGVDEGTIGASLVAPGAVDVDPDGDEVLIAALVNGYNCESRTPSIVSFDASGTETGSFELPEALYGYVPGLAAQGGGSPRAYAVVRSPLNDQWVKTQVSALEEVFPPETTLDPVTVFTATEAEFDGTVDANGEATDYRFEISSDGGQNWLSLGSSSVGAGDDPVAVGATAEDLDPSTAYQARLVASNAGGETIAGPEAFQTSATTPTIVKQGASTTQSEATMTATITTGNTATTYRFEYGPTAAYGKSTPSKNIAGTVDQVHVTAIVENLAAGSTYHFRVVAENSEGAVEGEDQTFVLKAPPGPETCPNAAIRVAQRATSLPECRAFEMVSPLAKGGTDVTGLNQRHTTKVGPGGDSVIYGSLAPFAGATGAATPNVYRARRSADGWQTNVVSPPQEAGLHLPTHQIIGITSRVNALDEDLSKAVVQTTRQLAPDAPKGAMNLYTREVGTNNYTLLTPGGPEGNPSTPLPWYAWATPGLEKVVFGSELALTPDAPASGPKVYVSTEGDVELVSKLPGPEGGVPSTGLPGNTRLQSEASLNGSTGVVSTDGRRAFFTAGEGSGCESTTTRGCGLYVRDLDTETTTEIVPGSEEVGFVAAALNGGRVLYSVAGGLWTYDLEDKSFEVASPIEGAATSTLAVTDDLGIVYFATFDRIYRWIPGSPPVEIATYEGPASGTNLLGYPGGNNWRLDTRYDISMTSDGSHLTFSTEASINGGESQPGINQVYVYDAAKEETSCVSCPSGPASMAAWMPNHASYFGMSGAYQQPLSQPRAISEDGKKVFFQSGEQLVAADADSRQDVYMWSEEGHTLLTPVSGNADFSLLDTSLDGNTVFIATRQKLSGHDTDTLADVYAIRANGGFPEPVRPTPGCDGGPCSVGRTVVQGGPVPSALLSVPEGRSDRRCDALQWKARRAGVKAKRAGRGAANSARGARRAKRLKKVATKLRRQSLRCQRGVK